MTFFSKLFHKKRWRCQRCGDFYGGMKIVKDIDSPANYAINDYVDVVYQILKCPGCGKCTIVGPNPLKCCGHDHEGVLVTDDGTYYTYCKRCSKLSEYDFLRNDEKGYYIEHYWYNCSGRFVSKGITRAKVLPTFYHNELLWE